MDLTTNIREYCSRLARCSQLAARHLQLWPKVPKLTAHRFFYF
jgi:hypothetical protein